jgi:hypothetical protein
MFLLLCSMYKRSHKNAVFLYLHQGHLICTENLFRGVIKVKSKGNSRTKVSRLNRYTISPSSNFIPVTGIFESGFAVFLGESIGNGVVALPSVTSV